MALWELGRSICPITLHWEFSPHEEQAVSERLRCATAGTKPFFFGKAALLPCRVRRAQHHQVTRELLTLKEQFSKDPIWNPHATLLIDEPATVLTAVQVLAERFTPLQVTATALFLYEFFRAEKYLPCPLPGRTHKERRLIGNFQSAAVFIYGGYRDYLA